MSQKHPLSGTGNPPPLVGRDKRLRLRVLNAETGAGIPSVQVDLFQNERRVATARSDDEGRAAFAPLNPGAYQVVQTSYPSQMTGISVKPIVNIGENGLLRLGSEPVDEVRLLNFHQRQQR